MECLSLRSYADYKMYNKLNEMYDNENYYRMYNNENKYFMRKEDSQVFLKQIDMHYCTVVGINKLLKSD